MRTTRIVILGLCITLLSIVSSNSVFANTTHVFSILKATSNDELRIRLDQFQVDGDGNRVYAQSKTVLPGEKVSYIPVITSEGTDCYVRMRVRIEMEDNDIARRLTLEDLYGLDREWKQVGEYIYYTKVLREGESIDAFQGIEIPHIWTQRRHESCGFTLYVAADAIQSANYTPNFNSDTPWEDGGGTFRIASSKSMPGGRDGVQTGDDSLYRYWISLFIFSLAVAVYSFWNRKR